ncbi:nucleotide sugar dehydrogenase, partial [Candidatus Woesearchaeota archaeon]|nr:nucleotide sugar dehydrogenase [Candidatus Woesearchaeota archaeon]
MKVSVIGLGKAGLPLAAVIADAGFDVIGVDINKNKITLINKGINPIKEEPGLSELIKKDGGKKLKATDDSVKAAKQSNVHIIIVPLFIDKNKRLDFSAIKKALQNVAKGLKKNDIVILETTVPVNTTETLVKTILEKNSRLKAGKDFYLAYSPERIMTGYSISRFKEFPKLI